MRALWLNSPFFDWRLPAWKLAQLHVGAALGRFCPFLRDDHTLRDDYVKSLLDEGWEFDLELKPPRGFGVYYGWLGAITDAHARVHRGLADRLPGARHAFGRRRHRARLAPHREMVAHAGRSASR